MPNIERGVDSFYGEQNLNPRRRDTSGSSSIPCPGGRLGPGAHKKTFREGANQGERKGQKLLSRRTAVVQAGSKENSSPQKAALIRQKRTAAQDSQRVVYTRRGETEYEGGFQ